MYQKKVARLTSVLLTISLLLFIVNKEFLRPNYGSFPLLGIVFGSLPNLLGSFAFGVLPIDYALKKKKEEGKRIILIFTFLVFLTLTLEEFFPFLTATKTFDYFDILASALGSWMAYYYYLVCQQIETAGDNIK